MKSTIQLAIGPVTVDSLSVDGKIVNPKDSIKSHGFDVIDRSPEAFRGAFSVDHPKNGISATIDFVDFPLDAKSTGPLKGVMKVLTGGTEKSVTIAKPHTQSPGLIDDPALKAAGLAVKFTRREEEQFIEVGVELDPKSANAFVAIELLSADGAKMGSGDGSLVDESGRASYYKLIEKDLLEKTTLKFRFREGAKEVDIPFEFPKVEVSK